MAKDQTELVKKKNIDTLKNIDPYFGTLDFSLFRNTSEYLLLESYKKDTKLDCLVLELDVLTTFLMYVFPFVGDEKATLTRFPTCETLETYFKKKSKRCFILNSIEEIHYTTRTQ